MARTTVQHSVHGATGEARFIWKADKPGLVSMVLFAASDPPGTPRLKVDFTAETFRLLLGTGQEMLERTRETESPNE